MSAPERTAGPADRETAAPAGTRRGAGTRGLWLQLAVILVAFVALAAWISFGDLSDTERGTLAPAVLWGHTVEHLELTAVAAVLVLCGSLFALTAAIGLARFPDTISRLHPGTKTQVLGLILVLLGAGLRLRGSTDIWMLVLAALFTVIASPVFAHLVGRAAYRERGLRGDLTTRDEMLEPLVRGELAEPDEPAPAEDEPAPPEG